MLQGAITHIMNRLGGDAEHEKKGEKPRTKKELRN